MPRWSKQGSRMKTTEAGKNHGGMATRALYRIMSTIALRVLEALSNNQDNA
jgi:hypothetical protein